MIYGMNICPPYVQGLTEGFEDFKGFDSEGDAVPHHDPDYGKNKHSPQAAASS